MSEKKEECPFCGMTVIGPIENELVYLAVPYSHQDPAVRRERFKAVNRVAAKLMREGVFIFSPISHTHPIELAGDLPYDWNFWYGYDRAILKHCKKLLVLKLDGWQSSAGVAGECDLARELGIPIEFLEPPTEADYLRDFMKRLDDPCHWEPPLP